MGFSRQEYGQEVFLTQGIEPACPSAPALRVDSFPGLRQMEKYIFNIYNIQVIYNLTLVLKDTLGCNSYTIKFTILSAGGKKGNKRQQK